MAALPELPLSPKAKKSRRLSNSRGRRLTWSSSPRHLHRSLNRQVGFGSPKYTFAAISAQLLHLAKTSSPNPLKRRATVAVPSARDTKRRLKRVSPVVDSPDEFERKRRLDVAVVDSPDIASSELERKRRLDRARLLLDSPDVPRSSSLSAPGTPVRSERRSETKSHHSRTSSLPTFTKPLPPPPSPVPSIDDWALTEGDEENGDADCPDSGSTTSQYRTLLNGLRFSPLLT